MSLLYEDQLKHICSIYTMDYKSNSILVDFFGHSIEDNLLLIYLNKWINVNFLSAMTSLYILVSSSDFLVHL